MSDAERVNSSVIFGYRSLLDRHLNSGASIFLHFAIDLNIATRPGLSRDPRAKAYNEGCCGGTSAAIEFGRTYFTYV